MTQNRRDWVFEAVRRIEADYNRSADTHLMRLITPGCAQVSIYLKDESTHPTGSLKHRLARSLFLYAICNGWVGPSTTIVEASSGSTAVSEAYFARLLQLKFIAVMPRTTSPEKIAQIKAFGGECHFVDDPSAVYATSQGLADACSGHYMDQFTFAERATDWRGNNNIAESIFSQMSREAHPVPAWIICGAGTGGTSATIGRYVRYNKHATRICIADPEASVFHQHMRDRSIRTEPVRRSLIEGIGRPRVEPSFIPGVIDRAIAVPDAASVAGARVLSRRLGRMCGGSTGTNLWAIATIASEMARRGEPGSIVSLLCDSGDRYRSTYFDDGWVREHGLDIRPHEDRLEAFFDTCAFAH